MIRIAVTGTQGQVVSAILERAPLHADMDIVAIGRPVLDLADGDSIAGALASATPDLIISAAAFTAVDRAEDEASAAFAINGVAPGRIGEWAAQHNIPVIHLSTDYVFDGSKPEPYLESDATSPLGVYGASKLAGEQALAAATGNHAIVRTAWVYSPFGNNFVKTMLRLAGDRDELRVVGDQFGSPTNAMDIADAVLAMARQMVERPDDASLRGVFHLTGTESGSWSDFATEVMRVSVDCGGPGARVTSITTAEYPTPARRPVNSRLDNGKLGAMYDIHMPDWRTSLVPVVQRLLNI